MFHRRRFFAEPRHKRPFRRGGFKYIILRYLQDKPGYGYEIIQALETRYRGWYVPSPGMVYPTLQMLQEMGYVTTTDQDGKRIYTITEPGRQFLAEHDEEFEENIPENINDIRATIGELERLAHLLRAKARTANAAKLKSIRETLSRAYAAISRV
ncbi:MAG: PadR family transcriptional regulator [Dehalococcoidales bacterium]|nr:PadR family transcriptional regulator [Dehalococcoidales bacterium]